MPADCDVSASMCNPKAEFIGTTAITVDHVQLAFREYFKDDQLKLIKTDSETIASGQGFTSLIVRVRLDWSEDDKKNHADLPGSAIVKALSKDALELLIEKFTLGGEGKSRQEFMNLLTHAHKTECDVYQMFSTSAPVPIARCYATWVGDDVSRPPLLLFEDLGDRARVLGEGTASLTVDQVMALAEAQANLHAWCLTTDVWRKKFQTFSERSEMFTSFWSIFLAGVASARKRCPGAIFDKLDDAKMAVLFSQDGMVKIIDSHKSWMPDVMVHGDFWANNIMFEKLPDGSMGPKLVAFIDWQISKEGNPMADLGRVMSMSFDVDLRQENTEKIVKKYYDTLVQKLGKDRMPKEATFEKILHLAHEQTALIVSYVMLMGMHDAIVGLMVPETDPDCEAKRAVWNKRVITGIEYASKYLNILP